MRCASIITPFHLLLNFSLIKKCTFCDNGRRGFVSVCFSFCCFFSFLATCVLVCWVWYGSILELKYQRISSFCFPAAESLESANNDIQGKHTTCLGNDRDFVDYQQGNGIGLKRLSPRVQRRS